ncbi:MAG: helix-turn-helix domain-containing protein [Halanaerobiales bacterium]
MDDFNQRVGSKLRSLRKKKDLSLSELEKRTGVSKSMLGQIERGDSSPTVKTLWKIARGLNVSFSSFVEEKQEEVTVVSPAEITPFIEKEEDFRVYPLFPFSEEKGFEIYLVEIAPGYTHRSEPHYEGTEEYLLVKEGQLEVVIAGETYSLSPKEAISFKASRKHAYTNTGSETATVYNLIYYGQ